MRATYVLAFIAAVAAQPLAAQVAPRIAHQPANGRPYSAAVQVGDMYWFSGKVGATAESRAMAEGRVAAETRNIMEAFRTLFTELGLDFGDVVQGTVFLADIEGYAEMNEVYGEYFQAEPPARETVAIKDLVGGAAIEISFVAVKR
ncbi:MAG TPA: Rid family hydrolase [Longimicrobiales bacterium]|nr:Rid family hydrolase [Longimicrobiales bacterium]